MENKHHTNNRSPYCKGVKMQKGVFVFIQWQIMHVWPTQTTQSISNKPPLHAFHSVNTNIIERVSHATRVFQFWTNQRHVERSEDPKTYHKKLYSEPNPLEGEI
jgi:hypothetical protein